MQTGAQSDHECLGYANSSNFLRSPAVQRDSVFFAGFSWAAKSNPISPLEPAPPWPSLALRATFPHPSRQIRDPVLFLNYQKNGFSIEKNGNYGQSMLCGVYG